MDEEFLRVVSSAEIVRDWGKLTLDAVKAQRPVLINKTRLPYLVLLPYDAYIELLKKARQSAAMV